MVQKSVAETESEQDFAKLYPIRRLQAIGVPDKDIKKVFGELPKGSLVAVDHTISEEARL